MAEYLSIQELHQLTGYARSGQQSAWLKFRGIPFKQDGARIIVSRVHVQGWLEGVPVRVRPRHHGSTAMVLIAACA